MADDTPAATYRRIDPHSDEGRRIAAELDAQPSPRVARLPNVTQDDVAAMADALTLRWTELAEVADRASLTARIAHEAALVLVVGGRAQRMRMDGELVVRLHPDPPEQPVRRERTGTLCEQLVQVLEESGEWMTAADVAAELGVHRRQASDLLRYLRITDRVRTKREGRTRWYAADAISGNRPQ